MHTENKNILFIINPRAGKQPRDFQPPIVSFFSNKNRTPHFYKLQGRNDSYNIDQAIAKIKPAVVVAIGGDGTIAVVAKKLYGTNVPMGIVPAGSANGMATELSIPEDLNQALQIIYEGALKQIDAVSVNGLLSLHLSDMGLNARLIKHFEEGKMRGMWGYVKVAFRLLFRKRHMKVSITTGGNVKATYKALMVVIANASKYGTGAVINPQGDLSDRLFEVVVIKQMSLLTLLKMWFQPMSLSPDHTEVIRTSEALLETHKRMHFQVDGEYIGKLQRVHATVLPLQLSVLIPKEV